jgi:hypothetical protein
MLLHLFARSACAQLATVLAGMTVEGLALALFSPSAWASPATVLTGTTGEGAAEDPFLTVGVGSATHSGGVQDR